MKRNVLFFLIGSMFFSACAGRNFPYRDPATYQSHPSNPPIVVQNAVSEAYYGGRIVKLRHDGDWWCARTEARFKDLAEGDVSLSTWRLTCVVEAEGAEMFPYACDPVDSCDYYSLIDMVTDERWEVAVTSHGYNPHYPIFVLWPRPNTGIVQK